jgi:SOS response regulatory protein OraA/RecX
MDTTLKIEKMIDAGDIFQLYITGLAQPLAIPAQLVHTHRLKQGIVITPSQLEQLQAEAEIIACENAAARMLAMREHTAGELRVKLKRKKFPDDAVKKAVKKFRDRGLLDDAHLARKLVEQSLERNPAGRSFLVAMLMKKHIGRSLAEPTVDAVLADRDETEMAVESLKKRWSSIGQLELERARTRAYNYLSRRGISYNAAREAFERLYNSEDED